MQTKMAETKHTVQLETSMLTITFVAVTHIGGSMKLKTSYHALFDQFLRDHFGAGYRRSSSVQGY